jgi:hypothetical protein
MLLAGACLFFLAMGSACAQGGPPMVTDDPDTPGDGHWEINLAAIGSHSRDGRWDIAAPDADINYGWGEHLQLKVDVPWATIREPGHSAKSGLGSVDVGVKWRFVDMEDSGYSMSIYPQFLSNWLDSSKRRGITSANDEFFLPFEVATRVGGFGLDGEIGRNFVQSDSGRWMVGGVVSHGCGETLECLVEVHESYAPHQSETLLNFGMRWKVDESVVLLASAGREFGVRTSDQTTSVLYLGVQWLH